MHKHLLVNGAQNAATQTFDAWFLMQKILLSLRPLACWHRQLGTVAQVQLDQPVRSIRALTQRQPPWLKAPFTCHSLPFAPRRLQAPAFPGLVGAGSLQHMHTNRLASEESPYLLQHQHNPVHTCSLRLSQAASLGTNWCYPAAAPCILAG